MIYPRRVRPSAQVAEAIQQFQNLSNHSGAPAADATHPDLAIPRSGGAGCSQPGRWWRCFGLRFTVGGVLRGACPKLQHLILK